MLMNFPAITFKVLLIQVVFSNVYSVTTGTLLIADIEIIIYVPILEINLPTPYYLYLTVQKNLWINRVLNSKSTSYQVIKAVCQLNPALFHNLQLQHLNTTVQFAVHSGRRFLWQQTDTLYGRLCFSHPWRLRAEVPGRGFNSCHLTLSTGSHLQKKCL